MSVRGHKPSGSVTQNQKAQLANAYNELGKELSSSKIRVVGNYTLGKSIGEGAYGKVRMGTHRLTSTRVAIKQIPKAMSASLTREIHHHRQLHHPHITQMYEVIATENSIWIVTELCYGGELFDYLVEKGRLSEDETKIIFGQLCLAVGYLHEKGIVHRDLKLENVLLDERCRVKLGDFGFTREYERGVFLETFCGTTGYAAPEMLQGQKYLGPGEYLEVDIWSLGIILYCLLTGGLPFDDDDENIMRNKIIMGDFEDPEWLSDESRDLIKNILVKDPAKRLPISSILAHPWFTASRTEGLTRADTVDSHNSSDASESNKLFGDDADSSAPTTPDEKDDKILHRTISEITIRKTELETLHTKLTATLPAMEEDEMLPPQRMPSNMSLAPPPVTRTPARTKRRSVSSIPSDPTESVEELDQTEVLSPEVPAAAADASQQQVNFASLLSTPAPVIFSTPLERELLNTLSLFGFDIAQIVHSVLSDACDATGALWWMLKRKAEKRSMDPPNADDVMSPGLEAGHPLRRDDSLGERRGHSSVGVQTDMQFVLPPRGSSLPHLSFVPATPTVTSGRPTTPPGPGSPVHSPMLTPSVSGAASGESTSRSQPSTPASSLRDREGKTRKGRSGSVSIMQRATTALEAAGLVRKKSSEAFKDEKDRREPERKGSTGEETRSSHGSVGPATSSNKLTKSPPLRPSKDHVPLPSTPPPSEDSHQAQQNMGSPWVLTASRDSLPRQPPTPANSPGPDARASTSTPNFSEDASHTGSTGKASGTHRQRANLLTAFRLWFNEDRKGKRKQNSPTVGPATSTSSPSLAGAGREPSRQQSYSTTNVKRRGSGPSKLGSRGHRHRASASSRRSSSVNSRRSSITSVQMIVLDSPQIPGRRSFGTHTPNSERGEHSSRPSSIRSFSMQRHRKSPSAGSTGSNSRRPMSPNKLHRRAGSGSSTRVVRHVQTTTTTTVTTPLSSRPPHMRSNSASSTHSPVSSRPNSLYEQPMLQRSNSDFERYRTGSPFKSNSRPGSRTRTSSVEGRVTTTSTTFVAQKRLGPFASPNFNGSIGRTSWKKSWGLEPPGWQTRTAHIPIEVLAMSPVTDGATLRDVFSGGNRHGLGLSTVNSFGDESDWVDEDDDIPTFAGGLGQMWTTGATQNKPSTETVTLSPAPRGHRPSKRTNRSGSGSSTSSGGGGSGSSSRQATKASPSLNTTPLPSEAPSLVYESVSGRRQIPGHTNRKGPAAIQEEDEEAEEE
ncbi:Serine/threonine-protein kinase MARK2 [Mycena chlorophos]|uniref:Serine/threonine-protein kinase MARK2 n=1 Tax=Mycena chlorophos TaxID=658473 RepID=A0A8H6WCQ0_MYCCL|nr:Serine/threonine-protein kinase MARK2 [Mycena chlorophos]